MIEAIDIVKTHRRADGQPVPALKGIGFKVQEGEFVTIRGRSGSGKSSLLNILGCLDKPTSGTYKLKGEDVLRYSDRQLSRFRCHNVGFIFQSFNLLPRTTAVENVEIPMIYAGKRLDRSRALEALARVGLRDRAHHYSGELSGGEQQRVAVARALINEPPLLLVDEPTGNLDQAAGDEVMAILDGLHREGRTILLVTHDAAVAKHARREILLEDGLVASDRIFAIEHAVLPDGRR